VLREALMARAARTSKSRRDSDNVAQILGRPSKTYSDWVSDPAWQPFVAGLDRNVVGVSKRACAGGSGRDLTARPFSLAADRWATLPDIALPLGRQPSTSGPNFTDRSTLVYEATLGSIRILAEIVDSGPRAGRR